MMMMMRRTMMMMMMMMRRTRNSCEHVCLDVHRHLVLDPLPLPLQFHDPQSLYHSFSERSRGSY